MAEAKDALRGVMALLTGDRAAPSYFDFSPGGVASSFVPILAIAGIELVLPALMGLSAAGDITRGAIQTAIVYAALIGLSALLLNLIGRRDALGPFVVTYNWTNAALTLLLPLLLFAGLLAALIVSVATIVVLVNVGRLVMTLKPGQIAMLLFVQLIGALVAFLVISSLFPMPTAAVPAVQ